MTDSASELEQWIVDHNARATKLKNIRDRLHKHLPISQEEAELLMDVHLELENAVNWQTTCLTDARLLDQLYEADAKREQAEARLEAFEAVMKLTRQPKPFFQTDFNVRRNGNRLTAYAPEQPSVVEGDVVIVGAETMAVLARVHSVYEIPPKGFQTKPLWAIEVDWTEEHYGK